MWDLKSPFHTIHNNYCASPLGFWLGCHLLLYIVFIFLCVCGWILCLGRGEWENLDRLRAKHGTVHGAL